MTKAKKWILGFDENLIINLEHVTSIHIDYNITNQYFIKYHTVSKNTIEEYFDNEQSCTDRFNFIIDVLRENEIL
jgi:hypothetical protein